LTAGNGRCARRHDNERVRRPPSLDAFLARLPLFAGLPPDVLARLAAAGSRRELKRGDVLFRQDEPSTGLFAVIYGSVALRHRGADGRERLTGVVGPGTSFAEPVMFLEKPYIVTASALADSLVVHVAKDAMFAELKRDERLAARIIAALAQRVEALVREQQDHALGSGARRLVGWLLRQPLQPSPQHAGVVVLATPKRALAARLKLSAEHLSRILRELSAENLVIVRGREIAIPDLDRLRAWQRRA
jgi:CRP-like cAMP-binding protein